MSTPQNHTDEPLKIFVRCRILELCRKNGVSRYWLSKNADISESNISEYVNCKTLPTLPLLKRICDAFGITLSQFFSQDHPCTDLTEQEVEAARLWSGLTREDRDSVIRHMQGLRHLEDAEEVSRPRSEDTATASAADPGDAATASSADPADA